MPVWLLWVGGTALVGAVTGGAYGVGTKVGDALIIGGVLFALVQLNKRG